MARCKRLWLPHNPEYVPISEVTNISGHQVSAVTPKKLLLLTKLGSQVWGFDEKVSGSGSAEGR